LRDLTREVHQEGIAVLPTPWISPAAISDFPPKKMMQASASAVKTESSFLPVPHPPPQASYNPLGYTMLLAGRAKNGTPGEQKTAHDHV
jgi:hypothetical protein